jgi:signal transduction histidine kinase
MIRDLPDENTPENMQVIIDESKRLTSLVTDLLDLSRLQSGTGKMEFVRFNLTEDTKNIIGRFAKLCEQEGFTILFERNEDVWVTADPERIAQVTYNFLINAITHTGDNKRIIVRQLVENGRVIIRVEDNGEGIPPENLPHIWERYYKADEVHKRAQTGSGLGLSIVKSILEQHPGVEYGVESTIGEGSTFWFSLPV